MLDERSPSSLAWRIATSSKIKIGSPAGCKRPDGIWSVKFGGVSYLVRRIVFCLSKNRDVKHGHVISHIDGDTSNNNPSNLVETTTKRLRTASPTRQKGSYNPSYISRYGVGIVDGPTRDTELGNLAYTTWVDMLRRCYSRAPNSRSASYVGCSVDEQWHLFSTFRCWFEHNYKAGWKLDKDILKHGNTVYGPETCIIVPHVVNMAFVCKQPTKPQADGMYRVVAKANGVTLCGGRFKTKKLASAKYRELKAHLILEASKKWVRAGLVSKKTFRAIKARCLALEF